MGVRELDPVRLYAEHGEILEKRTSQLIGLVSKTEKFHGRLGGDPHQFMTRGRFLGFNPESIMLYLPKTQEIFDFSSEPLERMGRRNKDEISDIDSGGVPQNFFGVDCSEINQIPAYIEPVLRNDLITLFGFIESIEIRLRGQFCLAEGENEENFESRDEDRLPKNFELVHSYGKDPSLKGLIDGYFDDLLEGMERD